MHRIECVPCSNRPFSNKEALLQHLKTSSAWHPVCTKCDKRFSSRSGLDAHETAKHPPTFDCELCGRQYRQSFALDDHYRGSPSHPNCPRCGKGFRDDQDLLEHSTTIHPKIRCIPCNELVYEDQDCLEKHYTGSPMHPNCSRCNRGCRDENDLKDHMRSHEISVPYADGTESPGPSSQSFSKFPLQENTSPVVARPSEIPWRIADAHHTPFDVPEWSLTFPESTRRGNGTLSSLSIGSPFMPLSSELQSTPLLQAAPLSFVPAHICSSFRTGGFAPLSTKPSAIKSITQSDLGPFGRRRPVETPPLRLSTAFASPLMSVQPPSFSPQSGLMPPSQEADELWAAKENRQISSDSPQKPLAPQPGPSLLRESTAPLPATPEWRKRPSPTASSTTAASASEAPYSLPFSPSSSSSASQAGSSPPAGLQLAYKKHWGPSSDIINWQSLLSGDGESLESEPFTEVDSETPRAASPSGKLEVAPATSEDAPSPALSAGSFFLVQQDTLSGTDDFDVDQISTLSLGRHPQAPELTFSTNATSSFLHSPDISRPCGLDRLPPSTNTSQNPLFDPFPEAQQHLPESAPPSPPPKAQAQSSITALTPPPSLPLLLEVPLAHVALPLPLDTLSVPAELNSLSAFSSPGSGCSVGSYVTSPQDPLNGTPPRSPSPSRSPSPPPATATTSTTTATTTTTNSAASESPAAPAASTVSSSSSAGEEEPSKSDGNCAVCNENEESPVVVVEIPLSPLHCRVCKADRCVDITATMCGHVFCNRCITEAVIASSRCPICSTPTLLYCLFRLDLAV